ncbi:MAG: hypothetical protein IPL79_20015 [Myxococcales bacterium]|nr:hypothetical protein [Myxococcales bacterium]
MLKEKVKKNADGEWLVKLACASCGAKVEGDATWAEVQDDGESRCAVYSWVYWECECGAVGCEKEVVE